MKPTFDHTVNILVKAYLNDTLEHANCSACAVGNLVAHTMGTTPILSSKIKDGELYRFANGSTPEWQKVFCSIHPGCQKTNAEAYFGESRKQIDSTGYTWQQLAQIELAFEMNVDRFDMSRQSPEKRDSQMFRGLMNVVDALAEIHGIDLSTKEQAKLLFVK